jgi:hypothetical protein
MCISELTNKNSNNISQFYSRLAKTKGNSKAAVAAAAAASKLLRVVYYVMKEKRNYQS